MLGGLPENRGLVKITILTNVQKTLVFLTPLKPLKIIPSLYLASSAETRCNNQSNVNR